LRSVETTQEDFLANLNGVQVLKLLFGHIQMLQGFTIAVPKFDDVASDFAIVDFFSHISLQLELSSLETTEVKFVVQRCLPGMRQPCSFGLLAGRRGDHFALDAVPIVAADPAARRNVRDSGPCSTQ
jgi:hypothetical protein